MTILKQSPHLSFQITQLAPSVAICSALTGDRYNWGNKTFSEPAFIVYLGCRKDEVEGYVKTFNISYQVEYSTFEEYCQVRWGMLRRNADRLIKAANVVANLTLAFEKEKSVFIPTEENETHGSQNFPIPINERQVRPLTSLKPEEQRQAWIMAVKTAPQGKITASHVGMVVKEMRSSEYQKSQVENPPEFPPPLVGTLVQIWLTNRTDPELNQYHKQVAIVDRISENAVIVKVWGKEIPPLFFNEVKPAPENITLSVNLSYEHVLALMQQGFESASLALRQLIDQSKR